MSNIYEILLRRGTRAAGTTQLPTNAPTGEPFYALDTGELLVGTMTTALLPISVNFSSLIGTPTFPTITTAPIFNATTGFEVNGSPLAFSNIAGTLSPTQGGTGVTNNAANTLTFAGSYPLGLTLTGSTSVTLPTSGTLATTSEVIMGIENNGVPVVPSAGVVNLAPGSNMSMVTAGDTITFSATGTINSGSGYAFPVYGSAASTAISPSNIFSDASLNDIIIPGARCFTAISSGTTAGLLVSYVGTTGQVATTPLATNGSVGVALNTTTTGQVVFVADGGVISCIADNTVTAGDLLGVGTVTAGRVLDLGAGIGTSVPFTTQIVGKAITGGIAGSSIQMQTVGAGHYGSAQIPYSNIRMDSGYMLGNTAGSTGPVQEISIGSGLTLFGGSLSYSGTASAGPGIIFYYYDNVTLPVNSNNAYEVDEIVTVPSSQAEQVDTINVTAATSPVPWEFYITPTPLGRTMLDGGVWQANWWASVNTAANTSSLHANTYDMFSGAGTITVTGSGTNRTATVTGGTPFISADSGSDSRHSSWIYIPTVGVFPISGYTSTSVVSITTLSTLSNPSGVSYYVARLLFGISSGAITAITPDYTLISAASAQQQITLVGGINDYLAMMNFAVSTGTTSVTYVHSGTTHPSNVASPLSTLHNQLEGLQGGTSNQYYHITAAQDTVVASIGGATGTTGTNTTNLVFSDNPTFTGTVTTPALTASNAGSTSAPTIVFSNLGANCGFYVAGSGIGVSINGTAAAVFSSTGTTMAGVGITGYTNALAKGVSLPGGSGVYALTTSDVSTTNDTGLSRGAAGQVNIGNGTAGDYSGILQATRIIAPTHDAPTAGGTVAIRDLNGANYAYNFNGTAFWPTVDNQVSLGKAANRFINLYLSGATVWTNGSAADTGLSRGGPGQIDVGNGTAGDASGGMGGSFFTAGVFNAWGAGVRFYSGSDYNTGLSYGGADGVVAVGNGTAGDTSGTLKAANINVTNAIKISGSVGSNGQVLTSNGTTTSWVTPAGGGNVTGPGTSVVGDYAIFNNITGTLLADGGSPSFRNRIINGDMRIDQRNAGASVSVVAGSEYSVDRFHAAANEAGKFTMQQNAGSVTPPTGFQNYAGLTSSSSYPVVSTDYFLFGTSIEAFDISDFAWGTASAQSATLSFWVYSSLTGSFGATVRNYANTRNYPFNYTISVANTWTKITQTIPGDTSGTWVLNGAVGGLTLYFNFGCGSSGLAASSAWTASSVSGLTGAVSVVGTSGATLYITGVQLEPGSIATPFERRSYGTEFALCQRYYTKLGGEAAYDIFLAGYASNGANTGFTITLPVKMRTAPAGTVVGTWGSLGSGGANPNIVATSSTTLILNTVSTATGMCQIWTTGTSTYITAAAEL